ncbi:unnamed protein product [Miscanthus lutarioriparius]|uniref:Uncharacterized protein n=1 Tax=Miscanthus lutarioriparius TaxID=422564 RepID=A0A811R7G5_9POAL|nr:unnamed protein product [Miscanthus lutarioriparius]
MADEKSSERNKKRRERDTTDQTDENSDWLHMHSTYNNGAEQQWLMKRVVKETRNDYNNRGDIVCLLWEYNK